MKLVVDIDGTICTNTKGDYQSAEPYMDRIAHFNKLYDEGHEIHYWTARGGNTNIDWTKLTMQQLSEWGVKYTTARMHKPVYDLWVDDKAMNVEAYFENITNRA